MAQILSDSPQDLQTAAEALKLGDVVAIPTETVYGLAGSVFNPPALAKIFSTKERPAFDPLIVHVGFVMKELHALEEAGVIELGRYDSGARESVRKLIDTFWPGPLTLVLPRGAKIPDLATSGLSTVGVRMPRHSVTQALIALAGPLAAPSANRFGRISPTSALAVQDELGDRLRWIVDGGVCDIGVESTIISVSERGDATLLRAGGTPVEQIEAILEKQVYHVAGTNTQTLAPGMLESHYAPEKPLFLLSKDLASLAPSELETLKAYKKVGLLLLSGDAARTSIRLQQELHIEVHTHSLSASGSLEEVAQHLFAGLREMDGADVEAIFAEPCTQTHGLGPAIADRLNRASFKRPASGS